MELYRTLLGFRNGRLESWVFELTSIFLDVVV